MAGSKSRGIGTGAAVRRIARPSPSATATSAGTITADDGTVPSAGLQGPASIPTVAAAVPQQGGGSIVAALQRQGGQAVTEVLMLAPSDIADHPDNPREDLGDLGGLVSSVREMGVLQPILVLPRREFLASFPHHAEHVGERSWVAVAGHRRRAAAVEAGLSEIPALTRADLANPHSAVRTFLAENVHRQELAPLEEARAFAMLIELGLTQHAVAAENGVSQSHVSKRLRLLQLSSDLQDAIRRGSLSIGDALVLSAAPAEDRNEAFVLAQQNGWPMTTAVGRVAQQRQTARQVDDADIQVDSQNAVSGEVHQDPPAPGEGKARTKGPRRTATTVASTEADAPTKPSAIADRDADLAGQGSAAPAPVSPEAVAQRADACRRLVRTPPAAARMLDDLSVAVLHGLTPTDPVLALTHDWIGDQIGAPQEDPAAWRGSVVKSDQPRLAWALAIASLHLSAADPTWTWTTAETHLAHQLLRTGWQPEVAEETRLQQVGDWLQELTSTTSHDSAESPHRSDVTSQPAMDTPEGTDA